MYGFTIMSQIFTLDSYQSIYAHQVFKGPSNHSIEVQPRNPAINLQDTIPAAAYSGGEGMTQSQIHQIP